MFLTQSIFKKSGVRKTTYLSMIEPPQRCTSIIKNLYHQLLVVIPFVYIYIYLENKLLLISINFTPKTSHSCLKKWYTMFSMYIQFQSKSFLIYQPQLQADFFFVTPNPFTSLVDVSFPTRDPFSWDDVQCLNSRELRLQNGEFSGIQILWFHYTP